MLAGAHDEDGEKYVYDFQKIKQMEKNKKLMTA